MALPITIPYTFGTQTNWSPLSQLDTDFSTVATALNGVSDGSSPLANVNIVGGNISGLANPISVPSGGTGYNSLTANSLLVGNGNSAVQFVAPGTSGNILYSNGTAWTSTAFIPQPGTAANVLTSNGTAWVSQSGLSLPSQTGNAGTVLKTNGTNPLWATALNLSTAVNSTSGTSILFTGIPSWAKRITVMFNNVGLNASDQFLIQFGVFGGVVSTGYTSMAFDPTSAGSNFLSSTSGFIIQSNQTSGPTIGSMKLNNVTGNTWVSDHVMQRASGTGRASVGAGGVSLSNTAVSVNITSVTGTSTFNAGTINISWE